MDPELKKLLVGFLKAAEDVVKRLLTLLTAPDLPQIRSVVIDADGQTAAITFSEPVTDVDNGGLVLTAAGVEQILSFGGVEPGAYEAVWPATVIGPVLGGQECFLSYAPGTVHSADGRYLRPFTNFPVTNNSTQT